MHILEGYERCGVSVRLFSSVEAGVVAINHSKGGTTYTWGNIGLYYFLVLRGEELGIKLHCSRVFSWLLRGHSQPQENYVVVGIEPGLSTLQGKHLHSILSCGPSLYMTNWRPMVHIKLEYDYSQVLYMEFDTRRGKCSQFL